VSSIQCRIVRKAVLGNNWDSLWNTSLKLTNVQFNMGQTMRQLSTRQIWRFKSRFVVILLGLILVLWSGGRVTAQGTDTASPPQEVLRLLREACFNQKELFGVLVQSCDIRKGEITLQVLLDKEEQGEPIKKATRAILSASPRFRELETSEVILNSTAVPGLRSELLPKLQVLMATNELTDLRTRNLLRRTRLDDARFDRIGGILFEATSLDPVALEESTLKAKAADCAENRLIVEIEEFLASLLPKDSFTEFHLINNKVQLRRVKSPVLEWQALAVSGGELDGAELTDAFYDETGHLRLTGSVQTVEQRLTLANSLQAIFDSSPICRNPEEAREAINQLEQSSFATYITKLRQQIWKNESPLGRSTRLRRVYFVAPGEATVEVETFDPEISIADDAARESLMRLIQSSHEGIREPELQKQVSSFREVTIKTVPSPVSVVQHAIAEREAMDGARIEEVSFDLQGQLNFRGRCNASEQEVVLRTLLGESLQAVNHPWADMAFKLTVIHEPTHDLLIRFREAAKSFDEVRINRLWFAEDGHLKVQGNACEGSEITPLADLFKEMAIKHLGQRRVKGLDEELRIDIVASGPSLLKFLRSQIAKDKSLEGVCLARGYYDVEGTFVVETVQDRAEQIEFIRALLKATAETDVWKTHLANGWVVDSPQTSPLSALVACLRTALPAYETLDGIDISSAFHDDENRLSFRGTIYCNASEAKERLADAKLNLEHVLAKHPGWKPRLRLGISLADLQIRAKDRKIARRESNFALQQISVRDYKSAIDHLNVALLNDPMDSANWFLRGLCKRNLSANPMEADQNFFRVAIIEGNHADLKKSRSVRIQQIQGAARNDAENAINAYKSKLQDRDKLEYELGIGLCVK